MRRIKRMPLLRAPRALRPVPNKLPPRRRLRPAKLNKRRETPRPQRIVPRRLQPTTETRGPITVANIVVFIMIPPMAAGGTGGEWQNAEAGQKLVESDGDAWFKLMRIV